MGKFYLYQGTKLIQTGSCPDGDEKLQGNGEFQVGLGDPPAHIKPDTYVPPDPFSVRRAREYPSIGDQLDALWKIIASLGTDMKDAKDMLAKIQEVKNKYPKHPNSR